jgi:hypothetical protein
MDGMIAYVSVPCATSVAELQSIAKEELGLPPLNIVLLHDDKPVLEYAPDLEVAGIESGTRLTVLLQKDYRFLRTVQRTPGGVYALQQIPVEQTTSVLSFRGGCAITHALPAVGCYSVVFQCSDSFRAVGLHADPADMEGDNMPGIGSSCNGICLSGSVLVHGGRSVKAPSTAVNFERGDLVTLTLDQTNQTITWSIVGSERSCHRPLLKRTAGPVDGRPTAITEKLPPCLVGRPLYPCVVVSGQATVYSYLHDGDSFDAASFLEFLEQAAYNVDPHTTGPCRCRVNSESYAWRVLPAREQALWEEVAQLRTCEFATETEAKLSARLAEVMADFNMHTLMLTLQDSVVLETFV